MSAHTPGPWPWEYTADGKRIVIGAGLVEGPGGYEVAEVYSDDCPREVAEANAALIASAPDLLAERDRLRAVNAALVEALKQAREFMVNGIEGGFIRMPDRGLPDTAHDTLPAIEKALARAEGAAK